MIEIIAMPMFLNESGKDILRFSLNDECKDVVLSESNGTVDLKVLFQWVLEKMLFDDVKITYVANPEYENGMYASVCEEYVKSLGAEISLVRERMEDEGLVEAGVIDSETEDDAPSENE